MVLIYINPNDWADHALAKLKKKREDQELKDKKFVESQRIKRTHGKPLWMEVVASVRENVKALNTRAGDQVLVLEETTYDKIRVRNHACGPIRLLEAYFDEEAGRLSWDCEAKHGGWIVIVTDDGTARFQGAEPTHPGSIATQMLDALFD